MSKETDHIKQLAVAQFNSQFSKNLSVDDLNIRSIVVQEGYQYGYEIETSRVDDNVRLRVYFRLSNGDNVGPYSLKLKQNVTSSGLGDEIYVAYGTFDDGNFIYHGFNKFAMTGDGEMYLLMEDGSIFVTEQGTPLLLEQSA